jgi:F0F1-type ATP synthase assembly protein I
MSNSPRKLSKQQQAEINRQLAPVYSKVGSLTFFVGLVALLVGLWIDRTYNTKPIFMLVCVIVSIPLVLFINTRMMRSAVKKAADAAKTDVKK